MPADVIQRVHHLARRNRCGLEFLNRDHEPILLDDEQIVNDDSDDDDSTFAPHDNDSDDDDDDGPHDGNHNFGIDIADAHDQIAFDDDDADIDDIAGVPAFNPHGVEIAGVDNNNNQQLEQPEPEPQQYGDNDNDGTGSDDEVSYAAENADDNAETEAEINIAADNTGEAVDIEQQMDERYGPRTCHYQLRARKPRDYGHLHMTLEHTAMTQYTLERGLKEFGDDGVQAVAKEMRQWHDQEVLEPTEAGTMTREEKRRTLRYLMFLKKKRCGRIKGRGCADGQSQRDYTLKEDTSAPTVFIESVMLSWCIQDANDHRDVATVDLPGAFMHANMDETVHIKLVGKMAELLVMVDPKLYRKYVKMEHGKPVLYAKLRKALYGTLKAALLFWKLLPSTLQKWGFKVNPYDPCVVNKTIEGSQPVHDIMARGRFKNIAQER